jgi:hypothetical protein
MITGFCVLFKAYTKERMWRAIGERLQEPCYLSIDDHDCKIRVRKQRAPINTPL